MLLDNISIDEVFNITNIDKWFLIQIRELINDEKTCSMSFNNFRTRFAAFKKNGFSDKKIAQLLKVNEDDVRNLKMEIIDSSKIQTD